VDETVWATMVAILKDPRLIEAKLAERHAALGARDIEVKSELAHLEREAAKLTRDEQRLLDLYLAEDLDVEVLRRRVGEARRRKAAVETRLEQLRAAAARTGADSTQGEEIRRACAQALRGLAKLDAQGRQALVATLVDEVIVRRDRLEIHGVLPGSPASDGGKLIQAS